MSKSLKAVYFFILLLSDIFAYYTALCLAYFVRVLLGKFFYYVGDLSFDLKHFVEMWWLPATLVFFIFISGGYNRRNPAWIEFGKLFKAVIISFVIALSLVSLGHLTDDISRLFICFLWFLLPFTLMLYRYLLKIYFTSSGFFMENTILLSVAADTARVKGSFLNDKYMGLKITCTYEVNKDTTAEELDGFIKSNASKTAILVGGPEVYKLFPTLHMLMNRVIYVPDANGIFIANSQAGQLLSDQVGYLTIDNSLKSAVNSILKRVFDLFLAIFLLPFILPLIGVLALIVRLTSDGPAIFSHERVGYGGRSFKVYKLRSMYKDAQLRLNELLESNPNLKAEWESNFKLKEDPRITTFGNFLRRTSLDELPQFFNVLIGNMSFIGPRPVLQKELDLYYKHNSLYYYMAKPGITGLWQVSGRSEVSYADRVEMDSWYALNWSLWLDIVILFLTPIAVIFRKGAY